MIRFDGIPEPIKAALGFVHETNAVQAAGLRLEPSQALAFKVANVAIREYFAQVRAAIDSGVIYDDDEEWEE